jgi:hypothetical protein
LPDEEKDFLLPDDLSATPAPRGFPAGQMVACEECLRANPPTRMRCLYCGVPLPSTETTAALRRPVLRPLEEWERGFNVVLLPRAAKEISAQSLGEACDLLRLERTHLQELVSANCALPLALVRSAEEADLITERLGALGFSVETFPDEALAPATQTPRRIRALDVAHPSHVVGRTSVEDAGCAIAWTEVALLVVGRIYTRRIELEERPERFKARNEIKEARELASDEAVLDIHTFADDGDRASWRIMADGFDYSCLGERKTLLARDNFVTLVKLLRERATAHAFDEDYGRVRQLLSAAWPPQEHTQSRGLRRERPGKFNTEALTIVSNETQFTRYSRLRRLLRRRELQRGT